jgi:hypothetical protein
MNAVPTESPVLNHRLGVSERTGEVSLEELSRLNVYQRIDCIIAESHRLEKTGWNEQSGFSYTPHDAVVQMIRQLCAKYHVVVLQEPIEWQREMKFTDKEHLTRVKYAYSVINSDNPQEHFELHVWGEGLDAGDKGFNKCSTIADKFFYFRLFQIPTGDDPDGATAGSFDAGRPNIQREKRGKDRASSAEQAQKQGVKCERCDRSVVPARKGTELISIERILAASQREYGKKLCADCQIALHRNEPWTAEPTYPIVPQAAPTGRAIKASTPDPAIEGSPAQSVATNKVQS